MPRDIGTLPCYYRYCLVFVHEVTGASPPQAWPGEKSAEKKKKKKIKRSRDTRKNRGKKSRSRAVPGKDTLVKDNEVTSCHACSFPRALIFPRNAFVSSRNIVIAVNSHSDRRKEPCCPRKYWKAFYATLSASLCTFSKKLLCIYI